MRAAFVGEDYILFGMSLGVFLEKETNMSIWDAFLEREAENSGKCFDCLRRFLEF
jgi:hypothetical protein